MQVKLNWKHALLIAASAVSAGAMAWASADPSHVQLAHTIVAACGSVVTFLGLVSGSAVVTPAGQSQTSLAVPVAPPPAPPGGN